MSKIKVLAGRGGTYTLPHFEGTDKPRHFYILITRVIRAGCAFWPQAPSGGICPAFLLFSSPHIEPGLRSEPLLRGKKNCKNRQQLRRSKYNQRINHRIIPEEFKVRLKKFDLKCVKLKSLDMHVRVLSKTLSAASNRNLTTCPFMISQDNRPGTESRQLWLIEWIDGMDKDPKVFGDSREIRGSWLVLGGGHGDMLPWWPSTEEPAVQLWAVTSTGAPSRRLLQKHGALSQRGLLRLHPLFRERGWEEQPLTGQLLRPILALSSLWVLFLNNYLSCVCA